MPTVNYLRVADCEHDAANRNESYREDHRNGNRKLMNAYLMPINLNNCPKMTNTTSTNVAIGVHGAIEW